MRRCCGEQQCTCLVTAGDGAAVTGNGSVSSAFVVSADLSDDAGNALVIGSDSGLFVPASAAPQVGCGLTGDGTPGAPIAVAPAGGQQAWPWPCDAAATSTLKCDLSSGALWTPPDHYAAVDRVRLDHWVGGGPVIGPTGGWIFIDANAHATFSVPANFLGNQCRPWTYSASVSGTWDLTYAAGTVFEVGYLVAVDGGAGAVQPLWGNLSNLDVARRERGSGVSVDSGFGLAASAPRTVRFLPAINVASGSVTVNSWASDAVIHTATNTP